MKHIGSMDMKFNRAEGDIHYYDVLIIIGDQKRKITLPRYDIMLGWVEIFGLPPQQEWVVLADIKPFMKTAILTVDGESIKEKVEFNLNKKEGFHNIVTTRTLGKRKEVFTWTEDYREASVLIHDVGVFIHDDGQYSYNAKKELITEVNNLSSTQHDFYKNTKLKHGKPDAVWKKTFTAKGALPHLFYKMFPIQETFNLSDIKGSIIEIGYLEKNGEPVDRAHGRWYKLIEIGNKCIIEEEGYSPLTIEVDGEKQRVKGAYTKKLYAL